MPTRIVTRFAPSPTGYLHIGGARTALFNWLYARGRGGKFLLRIEDTDRARHNEAAVEAIIDGLSWLGLDWDGEPISQYARRERHAEIAYALLDKGAAYRCYMTTDEIEASRLRAIETKSRFESPWRDADPATAPDGVPFTIRFRAPRDGETSVDDVVQGIVKFPNSALDDLIILRSDGAPTYNLAVVVDDHDMGVTHVIRGDDHLNNAARQQQIYAAMDWPIPSFSHVPLIHGADGAKLSKRHGALGVDAYRDLGFLPEGLANYLIRLGWSHGDDEIIPRVKALEWFDIAGINRAPARLDLSKLEHTNAHYMKALDDRAVVEKSAPFFARASVALDDGRRAQLLRAAPFLKERAPTLAAIVDAAGFLFLARPLDLSGKTGKALEKEGARALLAEIAGKLAGADWSSPEGLETSLKDFAADRAIGFGLIGQPLRAALTAGHSAPSLGEVLYALGREQGLGRIEDAVSP
ncbi:MAG: glutamate--tRNA ligase [Alphaproteobacteria bacterium RIFCSPHIGHO2_12_FULL_63_12]|nr:MAG: glutamate--tRNA ligase [Alphaproteobacteria bacterium RIFCSPHIGHO2_12_FULL_63_12]